VAVELILLQVLRKNIYVFLYFINSQRCIDSEQLSEGCHITSRMLVLVSVQIYHMEKVSSSILCIRRYFVFHLNTCIDLNGVILQTW
jgi:hypothetical protein